MADLSKESVAERSRRRREAERPGRDVAAAFSRWPECNEHAYFQRKGLSVPPGLRMIGADVAVPVQAPGGRMVSWQIISPGGDKRFKNGNRLGERYFFRLGGGPEGDRLYIAEDLAAAHSIAEAVGRKFPVLYAFKKSNMDDVAEWLLESAPKQKIVLCLDNEGDKTHRPRLKHERLIVLCPAERGDFNEHQGNGKERKKLLSLAPVYDPEAPAARPAAPRAEAVRPKPEGREARFQFYIELFQEKRAWTAGEIVKRAAKAKEAGGRSLSRAQVYRNLKALDDKGFLKKISKWPAAEYRAVEGFSETAERAARFDDSPETIEIESGEPENESFAAKAA